MKESTLNMVILTLANTLQDAKGFVSARDIYASLPDTPSMHRKGKREPSLTHISRVLMANGYRPEGKTRGGYTHYRKGE